MEVENRSGIRLIQWACAPRYACARGKSASATDNYRSRTGKQHGEDAISTDTSARNKLISTFFRTLGRPRKLEHPRKRWKTSEIAQNGNAYFTLFIERLSTGIMREENSRMAKIAQYRIQRFCWLSALINNYNRRKMIHHFQADSSNCRDVSIAVVMVANE